MPARVEGGAWVPGGRGRGRAAGWWPGSACRRLAGWAAASWPRISTHGSASCTAASRWRAWAAAEVALAEEDAHRDHGEEEDHAGHQHLDEGHAVVAPVAAPTAPGATGSPGLCPARHPGSGPDCGGDLWFVHGALSAA